MLLERLIFNSSCYEGKKQVVKDLQRQGSFLDYGFSNFQYKELGKAGDIVGNANVNKGN